MHATATQTEFSMARLRDRVSVQRSTKVAYKWNVLVVANRTAMSIGLEAALRARLERGPARFTLLVPAGRTADSERTARHLASRLSASGLEVDGRTGDADPLTAVLEVWSPARFDEIIVSTLPATTSRWLAAGLLRRIERQTGALVRHVEAREALGSHARQTYAGASV
jgi:hypothetical protein